MTETLFCYARAPAHPSSKRHGRESEAPAFLALMDRDRKRDGLKELQGRIWEEGFATARSGEVFEDVPLAFARATRERRSRCIHPAACSRSVAVPHAPGDLTPFIRRLDTAVGGARAGQLRADRGKRGIAAVRDHVRLGHHRRTRRAWMAGMRTVLSVRPGNPPQPQNDHRTITTLDDLA